MRFLAISLQTSLSRPALSRALAPAFLILLGLTAPKPLGVFAQATQAPAPVAAPVEAPTQTPAPASNQPAPPTLTPAEPAQSGPGDANEDDLKRQLLGKSLFLRGGFLGDSVSFNEHGEPIGHPAVGSYTLCAVEIDKVRLTKHKVELEGVRYALHFLGAMPYEDPSKAVERVKITPKKKALKITIDREQVLKPKKIKEVEKKKGRKSAPATPATAPETDSATTPATETAKADTPEPPTPVEEQAADPKSVTTTISPAHAAQMLHEAITRIFADGLDDKVRAQMPEFWQLYYQAQAAAVDYHSKDASVQRSTAVDTQAKLVSAITPDSNEFAQANGIAGRALYRVVIGSDGKPAEIAVVRPIGFGLDENAVAAIRKASFEPAQKGGQPVAESLDLAVLFRIYSKRTAVAAPEGATGKPAEPILPGPYSVKAPPPQP